MRIAHLCTAHGFGHMTRQLALGEQLRQLGCKPVYFASRPDLIYQSHANATVIQWSIDVGLVQLDSLTIDLQQTKKRLAKRCSEEAIDRLAGALLTFDAAVADVPPPGMEACRRAGIPVIATSNFEWAWIYSHYPELQQWEELFRRWQLPHKALNLHPGPGLFDFSSIENAPYVAREANISSLPKTSILVSFGGMGLHKLQQLLPRIDGIYWVLAPPCPKIDRPDILYIENVPYPDLIESCDIIFSKAGYSILAEAMRAGKPLILVERNTFPEAKSLEQYAEKQRLDVVIRCGTNNISNFHQQLIQAVDYNRSKAPPARLQNGAFAVAQRIITLLNE